MRLLGGDPETEAAIMTFIHRKYGVKNLWRIPARVADEIIRRPADFLKRAKDEANQPF